MVKPRAKEHIVEESVVIKLFDAGDDLLDRVILILLRYAGMRSDEVAHCCRTWWDGNTIKIPGSQECNCSTCRGAAKHPGIWTPKTREAKRFIPIQPEYRKPISLFFKVNKGIGLSRISIYRRMKAMARRAGVKDNVFPHAMRATYITRLLEEKVPDWVVRELVGHASVATTSGYTKFSEKIVKDELGKAWKNRSADG